MRRLAATTFAWVFLRIWIRKTLEENPQSAMRLKTVYLAKTGRFRGHCRLWFEVRLLRRAQPAQQFDRALVCADGDCHSGDISVRVGRRCGSPAAARDCSG